LRAIGRRDGETGLRVDDGAVRCPLAPSGGVAKVPATVPHRRRPPAALSTAPLFVARS